VPYPSPQLEPITRWKQASVAAFRDLRVVIFAQKCAWVVRNCAHAATVAFRHAAAFSYASCFSSSFL